MPIFVDDGRKINYQDYGSGPVALLIHGSFGNAGSWERVGQQLASGYRIIAPDLPGYGETSPQPSEEVPCASYAGRLIEKLIDRIGVPSVVAGHSYGGVVAMNIALKGSIPLRRMVLFEPVAGNILPLAGEMEAFATVKAVFDDYITSFQNGNPRAVQKVIDFWFGPGAFERMPRQFAMLLIEQAALNVQDVQATFNECYSAEAFQLFRFPVDVVIGDRSPDITHRIGQAIATLTPAGRLCKLAGADHAMITRHCDAVAQAIDGKIIVDTSKNSDSAQFY